MERVTLFEYRVFKNGNFLGTGATYSEDRVRNSPLLSEKGEYIIYVTEYAIKIENSLIIRDRVKDNYTINLHRMGSLS